MWCGIKVTLMLDPCLQGYMRWSACSAGWDRWRLLSEPRWEAAQDSPCSLEQVYFSDTVKQVNKWHIINIRVNIIVIPLWTTLSYTNSVDIAQSYCVWRNTSNRPHQSLLTCYNITPVPAISYFHLFPVRSSYVFLTKCSGHFTCPSIWWIIPFLVLSCAFIYGNCQKGSTFKVSDLWDIVYI